MTRRKIKSEEPFILASASPRRRELLSRILEDFTIITSDTEELQPGALPPKELVSENARLKAEEVALKYPSSWVLGSDTLVAYGDRVLGKPKNIENAVETLLFLSGKTHSVFTGIALLNQEKRIQEVHAVESKVSFKDLDEKRIREYFEKVNPLDKAGSYAIQEYGDVIIQKHEGSLNNIIGLPTEFLENLFLQYFYQS
jgi:septum formation protein